MTIHPAIQEIARRYDIQIEVSPTPLEYRENIDKGIHVFMGAGLSLKERKVWFHVDTPVEAQLHEVMHVITHPTGCRLTSVRENFVLMQVEREMARQFLTKKEFREVVSWQRETTVNDDDELFDIKRQYWLDDELWLNGYQLAKDIGLLDKRRRPTFQRPSWPKDPVELYFEWDQKYVLHSKHLVTIEDVRA